MHQTADIFLGTAVLYILPCSSMLLDQRIPHLTLTGCRSFAEARAQQLGTSLAELVSGRGGTAAAHASDEEDRRRWREQRETEAAEAADAGAQEVNGASVGAEGESGKDTESGEDTAVAALMRFEPKAAALVLEEEIREAVLGSITSAIGETTLPPVQHTSMTPHDFHGP